MKNFTKIFFAILFAFTQSFTAQAQDLALKGVLDLHGSSNPIYSGTDGKAIHLVALADITDLSVYSLDVVSNGSGSLNPTEYVLSGSALAGENILIYRVGSGSNSATFFSDYFGSSYSEFDITTPSGSGFPSHNGDDPVALFMNSLLVDSLTYNGNPILSGAFSGDPYEDSWAYRLSDGTWQFGGKDCDQDGTYSVYTSGCPYPFCAPLVTYTLTMYDSYNDGWDGASWTATGTETSTVFGPYDVAPGASPTTVTFSSTDPCFTAVCGGGSYPGEHTWTLTSDAGLSLSGGDPYSGGWGAYCSGCTDPLGTNYDATALFDDGSCIFPPCTAPAPTNETFSTGLLPVGVCSPNQWEISVVTGDGWRFTGTPGYTAGANGRNSGEYAWIDFSGTDVDPTLEVEDIDVSSLTTPTLRFDYFSDLGTYTCAGNNKMHVEAFDGTTWNSIAILDLNVSGWNTYSYSLVGFDNSGTAQVRFRAESSGLSCDFYNDLLLDDVKILDPVLGCMDPTLCGYNPLADTDDGSCGDPAYILTMTDSYGDGWSGTTVDLVNSLGSIVSSSTLSSGSIGTETLCLADDCYTLTVSGGSWLSEVGWSLSDLSGNLIASGGAPYSGSVCLPIVFGCMDPTLCGYDPLAAIDDGSCGDPAYTLTMIDSYGDSWNGNTFDVTDASGTLISSSTLSAGALGTDILCLADDISCYTVTCGGGSYPGEVSWTLANSAGVTILSGGAPYTGSLCLPVIVGCMDPTACNYDALATVDDGTCGGLYTLTMMDSYGDSWNGNTFDVTDASGTLTSSSTLSSGSLGTDIICLADLTCYTVTCGGGSYPSEVSWTLADPAGVTILSGGAPYSAPLCLPVITGCTDVLSLDYNPLAQVDDGSCTYPCIEADSTSSFETGLEMWTQDLGDNFNWTSKVGPTGSSGTGPSAAYDGTTYMYTETSPSSTWGASARLVVPCVDMDAFANPGFSMAYHMYGATMGTLNVDVSSDNGTTWTNVWTVSGDLGNVWNQAVIDLGAYSGQIDLRIEGVGGTSYTSDMAIDLTSFYSLPAGCTDPLAFNGNGLVGNYDSLALVDDGSCTYATDFNVDMNCEPAGSFGYVHLESPSFGWCGGCAPMSDPDGDGIHSITVYIPAGDFEYKYAVDGFASQEDLVDDMLNGGTCAPITNYYDYANRLVTVTPGTITNDTYGSCDACLLGCMEAGASNYDPIATTEDGSCLYSATFEVNMSCEDPSTYTTVHLESPFFGCFTGCTQMLDPDGDLTFSVTVDVPLGDFTYLYSVDNNSSQENLIDDMINGGTCAPITDYFSYANRQMVIVDGSNSASDVYGSCDPCLSGCTDATANNYDPVSLVDDGSCEWDVTFSVDMNCAGFTPTTLAATGPADGWSGNTYLLADADGDGVWTATYSVTDNFIYMYAADSWANSEFNGLLNEMLAGNGSCVPETDGLSYAYRVASAPSTTSDVYASCDVCLGGCTDPAASNYDPNTGLDDGSCVYATVFNVDMNCETPGSFGYVHLESPVFGWCGGCVPLTDPDGDGVHSVTVDLPLGSFEYKYAVDSWGGQEDLVDDMVNGGTCAPITDYSTYANRLVDVSAGTVNNDTYGSCDICDQLNGCTDAGAINFDSYATDDDGSCLFSTTFNVDMNCEPTGSFGYVHLESPSFGWCGGCVPMTDPDGDGVHSVTVDLPAGNFEYKYAVDGFAGQEDLIDDMVGGASCAPVTDYFSYANRLLDVNGISVASNNTVINGDFSNGITDWDKEGTGWAVIDSVADLFCSAGGAASRLSQALVFDIGKIYRVTFDANVVSGFIYMADSYYGTNLLVDHTGSYDFIFTASSTTIRFIADGTVSADLTIDNVSIVEMVYNNSPNTDDTYGSCSDCIQGCTDVLAFNYNDSAMVDDGSCLYANLCPSPSPLGLSSSDIYAEMATVHWADANAGDCRVWKYFVRYRPLGDTVWTTKSAGAGSGLCNVGLPNTSKVLRGLMASTTYEYKMKAFYCGGGESGYSYTDQFTTLSECAPMNSLAVQTFTSNQSKAKFTWGSTGTYVFARIALRVDNPGSTWQTAGGFGVYYPTMMVNKFGLATGEDYRAQGRMFCDANVTSYRSAWTSPIFWTQPGVAPIRLEGGSTINNFDVYPNPSKDIFNISFVSEKVQNLEVKVLNMLGEVIYTEGLEQFVGEYTKQINLSSYTKGVYFLEIMTNNGVVNKKIVLQ